VNKVNLAASITLVAGLTLTGQARAISVFDFDHSLSVYIELSQQKNDVSENTDTASQVTATGSLAEELEDQRLTSQYFNFYNKAVSLVLEANELWTDSLEKIQDAISFKDVQADN